MSEPWEKCKRCVWHEHDGRLESWYRYSCINRGAIAYWNDEYGECEHMVCLTANPAGNCEHFTEIPPNSFYAARMRLGDAMDELWREVVKAMRLERLVGWTADRMRQFADWWHGRK